MNHIRLFYKKVEKMKLKLFLFNSIFATDYRNETQTGT